MAEQQFIDPERLTPKGTVFEGICRPGALRDPRERTRFAGRRTALPRHGPAWIARVGVSCRVQSKASFFSPARVLSRHSGTTSQSTTGWCWWARKGSLPPIETESDREDFVVVTTPIDVRGLVEEAVILALPMVPRKPGAQPAPEEVNEKPGSPSPFAALAGLKRTKP